MKDTTEQISERPLQGPLSIAEFFAKRVSSGAINYVPNSGNAGDALIALGSLKFFEENGIDYDFLDLGKRPTHNQLVFAGGGGLVGLYSQPEAIFHRAVLHGLPLVVLPHTIREIKPSVLAHGERISVFCRELPSYNYVSSLDQLAYVGMDHDMAFHLQGHVDEIMNQTIRSILAGCKGAGTAADWARLVKHLPRCFAYERQCMQLALKSGGEILNCFRTDVETAGSPVPEDNIDVSDVFTLPTTWEGGIRLSAKFMLSALNRFDEIRTDRLHCCIAGILLGKRVVFRPNSYYKNNAVYQHSIRGNGYQVVFEEGTDSLV